MYDWFIDVRDYWEVYLDPQLLSRTPGSFLYVSFQGVDTENVYQAQSFVDNTLTVGKLIFIEYLTSPTQCIKLFITCN